MKAKYSSSEIVCNIFGGAFLGSCFYNTIGGIIGGIFGLCFSLYSIHVKNKNNE